MTDNKWNHFRKNKKKFIYAMLLLCLLLSTPFAFLLYNEIQLSQIKPNYIAHAGGSINGHVYTNSVEAVEHAISCGIKFIEMDLAITSDGKLVCVHDWASFNEKTIGKSSSDIPTYEEFKERRFLDGGYRPMTIDDIDSIWSKHQDLYLVTDKISDPKIIDKNLSKFKDRVLIECFKYDDYRTLRTQGYFRPMISGCYNIKDWLKVVGKSVLDGDICLPTFFCTHNVYFETVQKRHNILAKPTRFGHAVYTCPNRHSADTLFSKYSNVKLVYVDDIE